MVGAGQAMAGFLAEMRKLRGFPLESRARVKVRGQTLETVSTITKVLVGPHPRALFEPPAGLADRARGAAATLKGGRSWAFFFPSSAMR